MNDSTKKPQPDIEGMLARLEEKGISREEAFKFAQDAATKRQHVIEVSEDEGLAVFSAKLDKLQKSVDSIVAKLDVKDPT